MRNRLKDYAEYRRNRKTAKRELALLAAAALPALRELSEKGSGILAFITKLAAGLQGAEGERLLSLFTYMAGLSTEQIEKILVDSMVETSR